jgi:transcriptional regulator with XRE-family HTH domain/predicted transcriptional regulator
LTDPAVNKKYSSYSIEGSDVNFDATTFGHRLRHFRRRKGLTLEQLGELVGRAAPYLSLVENGKKEPRLSQIAAFARVLEIPMEELLASEPPNRRAQLEIELEQAQASLPDLGLPYVRASARLPDEVLVHLVGLYRRLQTPKRPTPVTAGEVHRINGEMTRELASVDGYLAEVELAAQEAVAVSGYPGTGPISSRNLLDLAATIGFEIRAVEDVPASLRSITDLKNRVIYIAQRNELRTRQARKAILQTLGRFLLGHAEPSDHAEFLRQRRETAYFASAVLVPELAAVPFLTDSRARRDLSVEDLREVFYVSYETAAHRLANLATRHLGIRTHLVVSNEEGIAFKAYENDGVPFPRDEDGGVEAQRLCREWAARAVFDSPDRFSLHYQYTDTPDGTFFCSSYVEPDSGSFAVTFGVGFDDARFFRGRETSNQGSSGCPVGSCCRQPAADINSRWSGQVIASPRAQARIIGLLSPDPYPSLDLAEIYEVVERNQLRASSSEPRVKEL